MMTPHHSTHRSSPDHTHDSTLFNGLPSNEVRLILGRARQREAPRGIFLFRQGEPATEMFLLESGRVRLHDNTNEDRELLIRFVGPNEVFGDKAVIHGSKYGATAVADTAVRVHKWSTETITHLLENFPKLSTNLFAIVSTYLDYSRTCYRLLATASAEKRIRWAVLDMAQRFGEPHGKATVISGRSVQSNIADLAATTISTANRVLKGLEAKGQVDLERGHIVVRPAFREAVRQTDDLF